ncbi:MAG: DUF2934 domain-containing protein [Phycisphaeraceae bacterium]|nr:DUF2934 domain-containing protein [Phycisphaeraceae bacterium]
MSTITTIITKRKNGTSATQAAARVTAMVEATADHIRRRAYEIFLGRNGGPGDHVSDWVQAEQELNGASRVGPVVVRAGERRERNNRSGGNPQPIRDGILDNR